MTNKINMLLNKVKQNIFLQPDEYQKEPFFYDLCPIDNVEDVQLYYNRFMTSISEGNKSIAFTGQYGVGKTSVINSILVKLHGKFKTIRISLGTLSKSKKLTSEELEMKILQQIIYTINELKLPNSRFKRIRFLDCSIYVMYLFITSCIFFLLSIYYPEFFDFILNPVCNYFSNMFSDFFVFTICFIFFMIFAFLFAYILFSLKKNVSMSFFKYKDLEIKLSADDRSIFNKYLDEIVYFFQVTKVKLVIIEDLDRYGNVSLEVFKQLKELNYVLNNNETINKNDGLIFLYSVRDDLFCDSENRVKFFDCIIPIIPKFSSNNIKSHILELYDEFNNIYCEKKGLKDCDDNMLIDDNLFTILSLHIKDRRLLYNIFMEYKSYFDAFILNKNINHNQLFALISYKNSNPIDFDIRLKNKGTLYNAFNLKETFIYLINEDLKSKIKFYEDKLERSMSNKIKDIDDLKKLFVFNNIDYKALRYSFSQIYLMFDSEQVNLDEFFKDKFVVDRLKNKSVSFKYFNEYSKISDEVVNKFISNIKDLNDGTIFINERIKFYKKQISENSDLTLSEIFCIDNIENILIHSDDEINKKIKDIFSNKLLFALIKNGYVKENFENDLSYFMGDNQSDYNFIVSVDVGDKIPFDYKIKNIDSVFCKIDTHDFKKESILNFYICDYILKHDNSNKKKAFFEQFLNINDYKLKFLDKYCKYDYSNFILLLKNVFNDQIFSYFLNSDLIFEKKEWFKAIIENISLTSKSTNIKTLKKYIESDADLINSMDFNKTSINNIILLDLDYNDYSMLNLSVIENLYMLGLFTANYSFYTCLLKLYNINEENYKVNDLFYNDEKFKEFYNELICSDFNEFYEHFEFLKSVDSSIVSFLNENIDSNYKMKILMKEQNKIENICDVTDKSLWHDILKSKKCSWNLKNLLDYFQYMKCYDDLIVEMLNEIDYSYEYIEHEYLEEFEKNLLYAKVDNEIDYSNIAKKFTYQYKQIDFTQNVNFIFLDELVKYNKVELNLDVFYTFSTDYEFYLPRLAEKQIDNFISIVADNYVNHSVIEDVLRSNINTINMIKLLEIIDLKNISLLIINLCVDDIVNSNIKYEFSDDLLNKLFDVLELEERVDLFIYLYSNDHKYISYFYKIYRDLRKVRDGSASVASFRYNENLVRLFQFLLEIKQINSLDVSADRIKISFSKTKLF